MGGWESLKAPNAPTRSLDSTELVDPVTLKVIPGPKMGTRRYLDESTASEFRVFFNCFLLEPIKSALGFSQPATLKNLRKRLCGGTLGCQALVDHWWIG